MILVYNKTNNNIIGRINNNLFNLFNINKIIIIQNLIKILNRYYKNISKIFQIYTIN